MCPIGYMGRQCQIKTMVPSTDLIPPMPDTIDSEDKPQMILVKPEVPESSQSLDNKDTKKEEEQTAEPLGPIVITDPPSTIDRSCCDCRQMAHWAAYWSASGRKGRWKRGLRQGSGRSRLLVVIYFIYLFISTVIHNCIAWKLHARRWWLWWLLLCSFVSI